MKLKVLKREHKEVETDLDLPVYVYLQDEFSNDEIIKITEKGKVTVKFDFSEVVISVDTNFFVEEHWLSKTTTQEHFNELYASALDYINSKL